MKSNIIFRMAARCEAAGRPNNEDNYQLNSDLSNNEWGFTADAEVKLGDKGALLVVCDGMGGMNAGEVASAIAVKTIKECFSVDKLTNNVLENPCLYLNKAIVQADSAIKQHSKKNPETEGMGSTIVMAWILGSKVYVGWCGDSRCYRFNPNTGLERLSHDHSYVQELVDAGKLTDDLAFDHPNNNIITRSLGDPRGAAKPDTKEFDLYNNDIILLCSDGLCGILRDNEIAEQIEKHQTSMQECRDALWVAAEAADWDDNVTIGLLQVVSGSPKAIVLGAKTSSPTSSPTTGDNVSSSKAALINANKRLKRILISIIAILVVIISGYFLLDYIVSPEDVNPDENVTSVENNEEELEIPEEEEEKTIKIDSTKKKGKENLKKEIVSEDNIGNAAKGKDVIVKEPKPVEVELETESVVVKKAPEVVKEDDPIEEEIEESIEDDDEVLESDSLVEEPSESIVSEEANNEEVEAEEEIESDKKPEKKEKKIIENPHDNKDNPNGIKSITNI